MPRPADDRAAVGTQPASVARRPWCFGGTAVNRALGFLLSPVFDHMTNHPEHDADLRKSRITAETVRLHKIRTVPPDMISALAGFPVKGASSARIL